jgi:TolB protein
VFSTGPTPDLFAIDFDGRNARSVVVRPARDESPAWAPDGKRLAWVSWGTGRAQIMIADADGTNVRRFVPSTGYDNQPSWSPDGRSLVFTSGRDGTGTTEIYVAAADGTGVRRLTTRPLEDGSPVWSPDGKSIAWHSRETNREKFDIYVMNADGSNQRKLLTRPAVQDASPAWSPDGRRILWESYKDGGEVWVANADGTSPQRIYHTPYLLYSPVWSPDGKLIAFTQRDGSGDSRPFDIWVARSDGSGAAELIRIDRNPFGVAIDWQPFADRGSQPVSLLRDGGAEDGFGGYFNQVPYLIPGWETSGGLSVLRYGLAGYPPAATEPPVVSPNARSAQRPGGLRDTGGKRFFFGGTAGVSIAVQTVSVVDKATEIDTGRAGVTLSGLLGGKGAETDEGTVVGTFLDAAGKTIGAVQIGPVAPADRGNATKFVSRLEMATLPVGTRRIRVTLTATRREGLTNDAYFENVALVYAKPGDPPPATPPAPVTPPTPPTPPGSRTGTGTGPGGGGGGGATGGGAGRLSRLRISPNPFAVAAGNTATIAAAPGRRSPRGTMIRYTLARAGLVTLKIFRARTGRRAASGRCVAPTRANRTRRRCTRLTAVRTLLRRGRQGPNAVAFTGRVGRRALPAGTYRLSASTSNTSTVAFRIVRR